MSKQTHKADTAVANSRIGRTLASVPVSVVHVTRGEWMPVLAHDSSGQIVLRVPPSYGEPKVHEVSAWDLRERFAAVRDWVSMLAFVREYGPLLPDSGWYAMTGEDLMFWQGMVSITLMHGSLRVAPSPDFDTPQVVAGDGQRLLYSPEELQRYTDRSEAEKSLLALDLESKFKFRFSPDLDVAQPGLLEYVTSTPSVLESIFASVLVDVSSSRKFGMCTLPDCRKIFEITTKLPKLYCSTGHANLASVRKKRGREAQAAEEKTFQRRFLS